MSKTTLQMKKIAKADRDTWDKIVGELKGQGKDKSTAVAEIMKGTKAPYLKAHPEKIRLVIATKSYYSKLMNAARTPVEEYIVHVISKADPRDIEIDGAPSKVADVTGVGYKNDKKNVKKVAFIAATFWRDRTKLLVKMKPGHTYKMLLSGRPLRGSTYSLSSTEKTSVKPLGKTPPQLKEPWKVIRKAFPLVKLGDLYSADQRQLRKLVSRGRNDFKLIKADVHFAGVRESKNGEWGSLKVVDSSMSSKDFKESGGFGVRGDASMARWMQGSVLYILGTIDYSKEYGWGMRAKALLPDKSAVEKPKGYDAQFRKGKSKGKKSKDDDDTEVADYDEFD